jgi:hypothetical protein
MLMSSDSLLVRFDKSLSDFEHILRHWQVYVPPILIVSKFHTHQVTDVLMEMLRALYEVGTDCVNVIRRALWDLTLY